MINRSWADIEDEEDAKKDAENKIKFVEVKKPVKKFYRHKDKIYLNNKWIKTQNLTRGNQELSQLN
jgi:hypothetical protein